MASNSKIGILPTTNVDDSTNVRKHVAVGFLTAAIIFSTEVIPVLTDVSSYGSINTEDLVILVLTLYFIFQVNRTDDAILPIYFPKIATVLALVSVWLLISNLWANFYFGIAATGSYLWFFKWLEVMVFFALIQWYLDAEQAETVMFVIMMCGIFISIIGLLTYEGDRVRIVFGNPNSLAALLLLPSMMMLSKSIAGNKYRVLYFIGFLIVLVGIFATGSRSGMIGLIGAGMVMIYLLWDHISLGVMLSSTIVILIAIILTPILIGGRAIRRMTGWVVIESGSIQLAEGGAASPIQARYERAQLASELFIQSPIFGHGWYASPSRIIHLDIHYTTLLVEVGVVGFVLFLILYALIIKRFYIAQEVSTNVYGAAGVAWMCGLIIHSIGGNPLTTPHTQFILFLFLTATILHNRRDV